MKKYIVFLILGTLALADDIDFKKGFDTAINAIRLEYLNSSNTNKVVNFHYPKLIYLDTKNLSTNEILLIQYIAFSNGFTDVSYVGEKLYFGSFLREADVSNAKNRLEQLLNLKVSTENNNNKIKYATPILDRTFFVKKREVIESGIKRAEFSDLAPKTQVYIPLQNQTEVFYINPISIKNNTVDEKSIMGIGVMNMSKFRIEKSIKTTKNKVFLKIYGDDIYLKSNDVEILK